MVPMGIRTALLLFLLLAAACAPAAPPANAPPLPLPPTKVEEEAWSAGPEGPDPFENADANAILAGLNDPAPHLRYRAARAARRRELAMPAVLDGLAALLADPLEPIRQAAAEALAEAGDEGFARLVAATGAPDAGTRRAVLDALTSSRLSADWRPVETLPARLREPLLAAAEDPDPLVRRRGLNGLARIRPTDDGILDAIAAHFASEPEEVGRWLVGGVARLGSLLGDRIVPLLESPDPVVRRRAARIVDPATAGYDALLEDPDAVVRTIAAERLLEAERIPERRAAEVQAKALRDADTPGMLREVCERLSGLAGRRPGDERWRRDGADLILRALDKAQRRTGADATAVNRSLLVFSPPPRSELDLALAVLRSDRFFAGSDEDSYGPLWIAARDAAPWVGIRPSAGEALVRSARAGAPDRGAAIRALGAAPAEAPGARAAIRAAFDDADPFVRLDAARAWVARGYGAGMAIATVADALRSGDGRVRWHALKAAADLGSAGAAFLPRIRRLAASADPIEHAAATAALRAIREEDR